MAKLHPDQKRLQNTVLPQLMLRTNQEGDSQAERDCTVVNRAFNQGPDPLYLMEVSGYLFEDLCRLLALKPEEGRKAPASCSRRRVACPRIGRA